MESNHVGKYHYWALLTPLWDSPFRYREYSGRRHSQEAAFENKADMWLYIYIFCKTCMKHYDRCMLYKSVINFTNCCNIVGYILMSMDVWARRSHFYSCMNLII